MSNDKKPKKAKPTVVHGATSRGSELSSSRLSVPVKASPLSPAKKKK